MLIDIAEREKEQITESFLLYQGADPNRFSGHDQDIMNPVLRGYIIIFIDRRYVMAGLIADVNLSFLRQK